MGRQDEEIGEYVRWELENRIRKQSPHNASATEKSSYILQHGLIQKNSTTLVSSNLQYGKPSDEGTS